MERLTLLLLCFGALCSSMLTSCNAVDTLFPNEPIRDGDTIFSSNELFEFGFFSPNNSTNQYLGIWYKKISNGTIVWVANRDTPLNNTLGTLRINSDGILQLISDGNITVWSSTPFVSTHNIISPVLQLLDNGNLVVRNETNDDDIFIWQSFDYPGDTYLPGMKFGKDFVTGIDRQWVSWKSVDDPSIGEYVSWMDTNGFPQIFERKGSVLHTRYGPWNGVRFSGMPSLRVNPTSINEFVFNENEIYYGYETDDSVISRMHMNPEGGVTRMNWINSTQSWVEILTLPPSDSCVQYGLCGPYGSCSINNFPLCSCMEGFDPKIPEEWNGGNWSGGCVRRARLDCGTGDGFRRISGVKVPDTRNSRYNMSMSLEECEMVCRMDCSCTAYANLDIRNGGSGCLLWFDELMDIREYNETQNLFIRMAVSELTSPTTTVTTARESSSNKKKQIIIAVVLTLVGLIIVGLTLAKYARNKNKRSCMKRRVHDLNDKSINGGWEDDADIPSFSLSKITKSTNNFSDTNKLGEGGFGPVYKGVLDDGQEIAVKRLSKTSTQGLDEFKNEVRCIAKLQHRNLVKLMGYCVQRDEIMLIYEYMANKSLDLTLFDDSKNTMLDWPQRFRIIHGIARGLLYLHQDSRLRVIHRDLKAANVLLDVDMNPKISDFGIARRFIGYETQANTNKVVGTYGYISPEYAVHGLFSVKSDVFSFGVLLLEIVSGLKNRGFTREEHSDNLLGHAWRLYKEDRSLELASSQLKDTCINSELLRSIHIGLLCVQHHAEDRPTMSSVVAMLDNENTLPPPKQPAFFTQVILTPTHDSLAGVTLTILDGR